MTSLPKNIRTSASQLFFQDKESSQYKAILEIASLPHPDRAILGCFIEDAVNPQEAARYFLSVSTSHVAPNGPPEDAIARFLSKWKTLLEKCKYVLLIELLDC